MNLAMNAKNDLEVLFTDTWKKLYAQIEQEFKTEMQQSKGEWAIGHFMKIVETKVNDLAHGISGGLISKNFFKIEIIEAFNEYYYSKAIDPTFCGFLPEILNIRDRHIENQIRSDFEPEFLNNASDVDLTTLCATYHALIQLQRYLNEMSSLPDTRIKGKLSTDQVRAYFMQLTNYSPKPDKERKLILTAAQVEHLLRANFCDFFPKAEVQKMDTPGITQANLRKFVYDFYSIHCIGIRTEEYVQFLMQNFSSFDKSGKTTISSNFSRKARK